MITPRPSSGHTRSKPGFPMTPFLGVEPVLYNDQVNSRGCDVSVCDVFYVTRMNCWKEIMCLVACVLRNQPPVWPGPYMEITRDFSILIIDHTQVCLYVCMSMNACLSVLSLCYLYVSVAVCQVFRVLHHCFLEQKTYHSNLPSYR